MMLQLLSYKIWRWNLNPWSFCIQSAYILHYSLLPINSDFLKIWDDCDNSIMQHNKNESK